MKLSVVCVRKGSYMDEYGDIAFDYVFGVLKKDFKPGQDEISTFTLKSKIQQHFKPGQRYMINIDTDTRILTPSDLLNEAGRA